MICKKTNTQWCVIRNSRKGLRCVICKNIRNGSRYVYTIKDMIIGIHGLSSKSDIRVALQQGTAFMYTILHASWGWDHKNRDTVSHACTINIRMACYIKNPYCLVDGSTVNTHRSIFKAWTSLKKYTETSIIFEVLLVQMVVHATHKFTFLLQ